MQEGAIDELERLPKNNPFRDNTLQVFYSLFKDLEANKAKYKEDQELEGICKRKIKARDVGASRQSSRDRQSFRSSEAVAHSLYSSVLPTPQPPSQELGEGGGLCRFRPWTFLPLLSLPFLYRHPLVYIFKHSKTSFLSLKELIKRQAGNILGSNLNLISPPA